MGPSLVGRTLKGVRYFNLPHADWTRTPGMHRLDFGLDLEFDDEVVGTSWSRHGGLQITQGSLRAELVAATEQDASTIMPWQRAINREITAASANDGEPRQSTNLDHGHWSLQLEFESEAAIWLVAATFVETVGVLMEGGDELIVIWDGDTASRLGLR